MRIKRLRPEAVAAGLAVAGLGACETGAPFRDRADLVAPPPACVEQRVDIYFAENQARLTDPARQLIDLTGQRLAACQVDRVEVIGLASATGASAHNQTLSEQRAHVVADAIREAGWPAPEFALAAVGDEGALTETGLAEPLRRRTEVVIHARPR